MPETVTMYSREEIVAFVWDVLDAAKKLDEEIVKDWVRSVWEDPGEVYEL